MAQEGVLWPSGMIRPYQNSSMGFVNQFVKIEYIFKIKKYCII